MIYTALLVLLGIIVFFAVLQKISDRTYKPTRAEIIHKLNKMIDGSIDYGEFDELTSVRIAYDKSLEEIRNKLNNIIDDTSNVNHPHSKTKIIDFNEAGKKRVVGLIKELEKAT